jgi:hypothetical protein
MPSAALPVAGWPVVAYGRVRTVLRAHHGKVCRKTGRFAPAAAGGDSYFAEQHPGTRGGIAERGHAQPILGRQRRMRHQQAGIHFTRAKPRGDLDSPVPGQVRSRAPAGSGIGPRRGLVGGRSPGGGQDLAPRWFRRGRSRPLYRGLAGSQRGFHSVTDWLSCALTVLLQAQRGCYRAHRYDRCADVQNNAPGRCPTMVVLIHARHPQPLHDTAAHATAEHNILPPSTEMTEWL